VCDEETKLIADWERRPRLIQGQGTGRLFVLTVGCLSGEAAEAEAGAGAAGESGGAAAAGAGAGAGAGAAAESKGPSKPAAAAASAKAAESAGPTTAAQRLSGAALHEYMDAMARKEVSCCLGPACSLLSPFCCCGLLSSRR
jgi:hypothetical protein